MVTQTNLHLNETISEIISTIRNTKRQVAKRININNINNLRCIQRFAKEREKKWCSQTSSEPVPTFIAAKWEFLQNRYMQMTMHSYGNDISFGFTAKWPSASSIQNIKLNSLLFVCAFAWAKTNYISDWPWAICHFN